VNIEPLRKYLEGVDAYKSGDKDLALQLLASSIGASEPTDIMRDSLDNLISPNDATLTLILHECKGD